MATTAKGSTYTRNTSFIIALACLAFLAYCLYDGWVSENFQKKYMNEDGSPSVNLQLNRYYMPIGCGAAALYFLINAVGLGSKKIVADDSGLTVNSSATIPYANLKKIDKSKFKSKGVLMIDYESGGVAKQLKLSDRTYDNLGLLLDEIVAQTGAAPANKDQQDDK